MCRPPAAGIGEANVVEGDAGREVGSPGSVPPILARRAGKGRGRGSRGGNRFIQKRIDACCRRLSGQALVQHRPQLAQRAEDLGARHQHDQQRLQAHLAVTHAIRPHGERCGGAKRTAEIGDAARQDAGAEYQERAVRERLRLVGQHPPVAAALTERLQRRQALHGIEEFFAESLERALPLARRLAGALVHHRWRDQREQRRSKHDRGDRHVPERHEGEDRHRCAGGDRHLRNVLAEEGLQLLDAIDDRQHHTASAFRAEPCGTEFHDLVIEPAAQRLLNPRRGPVRDHGA